MFCNNCGTKQLEGARFCEKCGAQLASDQAGQGYMGNTPQRPQNVAPVQNNAAWRDSGQYRNPYDAPSGGMAALGFFFPIVGLILYLVWKAEKPLRARSAGKGALIGVIVYVALCILTVFISLVVGNSILSNLPWETGNQSTRAGGTGSTGLTTQESGTQGAQTGGTGSQSSSAQKSGSQSSSAQKSGTQSSSTQNSQATQNSTGSHTNRANRLEGDYVIPDSNSRYLTDSELKYLSLQELNYAKNEIFARKGRKFQSKELQDYFNSKAWYRGTIEPEAFQVESLSACEKANAELLSRLEFDRDSKGYQLDSGTTAAAAGSQRRQAMDYVGRWVEAGRVRCGIDIEPASQGNYLIKIHGSESLSEGTDWSFVGTFDSETGAMLYSGSRVDYIHNIDEVRQETVVYTEGQGELYIEDNGMLYWDDYVDNAGQNLVFFLFNPQ